MREYFPKIYGNDSLKQRLGADITNNTLSHAYIIEGLPGSGKMTLAKHISAALFCENRYDDKSPLPCLECEGCRRVIQGISPDVISITKEDRATIGVDSVRYIRNDMYLSPNESDSKIYIIEEANLMTPQAQNAFLKALEEPPSTVLFLLLSENGESLLDTIKSRAPTLRTERHRPKQLEDFLIRISREAQKLKEKSPAELSEVIMGANGSIGNALHLLSPSESKSVLAARAQASNILDRFLSHGTRSDFLSAFLTLVQKRADLSEILRLISLGLRDILLIKKYDAAELCFFTDRDTLSEKASRISAYTAINLSDATVSAADNLNRNANINTLVLNYANTAWNIINGGSA